MNHIFMVYCCFYISISIVERMEVFLLGHALLDLVLHSSRFEDILVDILLFPYPVAVL